MRDSNSRVSAQLGHFALEARDALCQPIAPHSRRRGGREAAGRRII
jgi:hypothetical protein